jgi:rubrerythrin
MSFFNMPTPAAARRIFLGRSGGLVLSGAAIALLAGNEALAAKSGGAKAGDVKILNGAIAAELEAIAAYQLGGKPAQAKSAYNFPVEKLKAEIDVIRFAARLEQGAVSAYVAAVPLFGNRDLARAAATILGDEAMHWAILRQAMGEVPVPGAFVG